MPSGSFQQEVKAPDWASGSLSTPGWLCDLSQSALPLWAQLDKMLFEAPS